MTPSDHLFILSLDDVTPDEKKRAYTAWEALQVQATAEISSSI